MDGHDWTLHVSGARLSKIGRIGTLGEISQDYKNCRGRFCGAYRAQFPPRRGCASDKNCRRRLRDGYQVHLPPKKSLSNDFLLESYKDSSIHS